MTCSELDPLNLSIEMMNIPSVSPSQDEAIDHLIAYLEPIGFICYKLRFSDVTNLYARKGSSGRNLCFAGHVDVVPAGEGWDSDPFIAEIKDGYLYGRGAVDMKPAIAAFIAAVSRLTEMNDNSISLLISGNEEGDSTYGTPKVLEWLDKQGEKLDACIVGEPTNPSVLGQMIKVGRRGSINFELVVKGIQGHAAYPDIAVNPVNKICFALADLKRHQFDGGTSYFPPSNLEVTNIHVGNSARNVIPASASASINIRFNDLHNKDGISSLVGRIIDQHTKDYELKVISSFDPFFNEPGELALIAKKAVKEVTGLDAVFGSDGGTSDARFIHKYCPIIEFGLNNEMAHKANERVKVSDIRLLTDIYCLIITKFFSNSTSAKNENDNSDL